MRILNLGSGIKAKTNKAKKVLQASRELIKKRAVKQLKQVPQDEIKKGQPTNNVMQGDILKSLEIINDIEKCGSQDKKINQEAAIQQGQIQAKDLNYWIQKLGQLSSRNQLKQIFSKRRSKEQRNVYQVLRTQIIDC
ncbi:hypothetical protein ABPG72_010695 [Tetrahymena utriculariae]